MKWKKEREEIVKYTKQIYKKGFVTAHSGNISLRVGDELILITPSSKSYEKLKSSDIVEINFEGNIIDGHKMPSSEYKLHVEIYKSRKDVNAVIHTHSIFACTMAALNLSLPVILDEQKEFLGGEISVANYAPSGTDDLAIESVKALADKKAVFLSKHGAVTVGQNINEAFYTSALLEKLCQIYLFIVLIQKQI